MKWCGKTDTNRATLREMLNWTWRTKGVCKNGSSNVTQKQNYNWKNIFSDLLEKLIAKLYLLTKSLQVTKIEFFSMTRKQRGNWCTGRRHIFKNETIAKEQVKTECKANCFVFRYQECCVDLIGTWRRRIPHKNKAPVNDVCKASFLANKSFYVLENPPSSLDLLYATSM